MTKCLRQGRGCVLAAALLVGSWGCTSGEKPHLVHYDFEGGANDMWRPANLLTTEQAYSGKHAIRAVGPTDTIAFALPLYAMGAAHHIRFSARLWLLRSPARYAPIKLQVWRGDTCVQTQYLPVDEVVRRYDAWVPTTTRIRLPRSVEPTDQLRLTWPIDQPDTKVFLDDLTLDNAW